MDFNERLQKAIDRGQRVAAAKAREAAQQAMSEEECRRLHSRYRLELTEHAEACLHRLADNLPGFRVESVHGDRGWGAAASRDDMMRMDGSRKNVFSRLELTVRPMTSYHVLELNARGTVRNKELLNRNFFQPLGEVDIDMFRDQIDRWVLEYAELYSAAR